MVLYNQTLILRLCTLVYFNCQMSIVSMIRRAIKVHLAIHLAPVGDKLSDGWNRNI